MSAQILGVSGSPRRDGNTDIAVRRVVDGIASNRGQEAEFIRIADFDLEHCLGCRRCMTLGRCAIEGDDLDRIMAQFFAAETIIIGSPVYWLSPPGILKDLMDRSHGWYSDLTVLSGKRAAVISVAADSGFEPHEQAIEAWLACYGAEVVAKARILAREKGEVLNRPEELRKLDAVVAALSD